MKKLFVIVSIFALIGQIIPSSKVRAEAVYDDIYNSGDVFITSDADRTFEAYGAGTNFSSIYGTPTDTAGSGLGGNFTDESQIVAFTPIGDLVIAHFDKVITCFTKSSGFTQECTWSGIDLDQNSTLNAMTDFASLPTDMMVAANGDLIVSHYGLGAGRYISITTAASNYTTTTVKDLSYSGTYGICWMSSYTTSGDCTTAGHTWYTGAQVPTCVDTVTNTNATDCGLASGTWLNQAPLQISMSPTGNIWVSEYGSGDGTGPLRYSGERVFCLDVSNNYNACTGAGFEANGSINLYTATGNMAWSDVNVNTLGDVYVTSVSGSVVMLDSSNSYNLSSINLAPSWGFYHKIDSSNNIWFNTFNGTNATLICLSSSLGDCAGLQNFCSDPGYANQGTCEVAGKQWVSGIKYDYKTNSAGIFISKDTPGGSGEYIWTVQVDSGGGDDRLYCFDPENSAGNYQCSGTQFDTSTDSFARSFLAVGNLNDNTGGNIGGDPTGIQITRLMNVVAGQNQTNITAVVDPTISLSITSTCNLAGLNATTITSCALTSLVSTNALTGYSAYIKDASGNLGTLLRTGSSDVIAVSDGSILSTLTTEEGFGATTSLAGQVIAQHTDSCATTTTVGSLDVTALSAVNQSYASANGPVSLDEVVLCLRAKPSLTTPAGTYTTTLTITAVGSF